MKIEDLKQHVKIHKELEILSNKILIYIKEKYNHLLIYGDDSILNSFITDEKGLSIVYYDGYNYETNELDFIIPFDLLINDEWKDYIDKWAEEETKKEKEKEEKYRKHKEEWEKSEDYKSMLRRQGKLN